MQAAFLSRLTAELIFAVQFFTILLTNACYKLHKPCKLPPGAFFAPDFKL